MPTDPQHLEVIRYLRGYLDPTSPIPQRPEGLDHLFAAVEEELSAHDSDDQRAALSFLEAELAGPEAEAVAWRAVKPHVYPLPRLILRALELETLRAKVEGLEEQLVEERQRAQEHAREARAWREDAEFWVQCERDTARWAACQPVAASTKMLLRAFAEPDAWGGKRRDKVLRGWLEDGAPNYRPVEEVQAEIGALPREDRLQAEVQRLREQVRTQKQDLAHQVEAMKADKDGSFRRGHAAGAKAYQLRFRELSEHLRSLDLQPYTMPPTLARLLEACEQVPSPGPDAILAAAADWREAGALRPGRLERRPIETLPEERDGPVLIHRPVGSAFLVWPGWTPPRQWVIQHPAYWSPLPPLSTEQDTAPHQHDGWGAEDGALLAFARDVARLLAPVHAQDVAAKHLTSADLPDLLDHLRERMAPVGGVDVERDLPAEPEHIERRPIETLPEEREEDVLVFGRNDVLRLYATEAFGGAHHRHIREWSPLPPLAEQDALLPREEVCAELRAAGLEPGKVGREMRLRLEKRVAEQDAPDHTCPGCGWAGDDSDLVEKMSGRLCPVCSRVLAWPGGGVRLPVADPGSGPTVDAVLGFLWPDDEPRDTIAEDLAACGVDLDAAEEHVEERVQAAIAERREAEPEPVDLATGWCSACKTDLRPHGPDTRPTDDGTAREWVCPECEYAEPNAPGLEPESLTLDDLRPLLVEGWEMPEAPVEGAVPRACFVAHRQRWALMWTTEDEWGPCSHGHIRPPFCESVEVTADMLRLLGFVVDEGAS